MQSSEIVITEVLMSVCGNFRFYVNKNRIDSAELSILIVIKGILKF